MFVFCIFTFTWIGCWCLVFIRNIIYKLLNVCHFDFRAFEVGGRVWDPVSCLITPNEWVLSVFILIDNPHSVPQLLCNRTLQFSKIFRLNINAMGFLRD